MVGSLPCAGPGSRAECLRLHDILPPTPHAANTIMTHRLAGGEAPGGVAVHAWPRSKPIHSALGLHGTPALPPRLATSTEQHQHRHPGPCSQPVPPQLSRHGLVTTRLCQGPTARLRRAALVPLSRRLPRQVAVWLGSARGFLRTTAGILTATLPWTTATLRTAGETEAPIEVTPPC